MSQKLPLSVVVLAKNEATRIADCLKSAGWADELLVIDDDSADQTVEIAESLGARVLKRKMDIEGRHRNWAHAQAKHEWVFSLDSDERVTPELEKEIRDLFEGNPANEIYTVPRRNYLGKHWIRRGGWYPSPQVKLFKPAVFRWEETTVHPRAISDKSWGRLQGDLIHYSYRDVSDFIGKLNRQTTLETQKWVMDGRKMPTGKALWRTIDRFYRTYWLKKGKEEGFLGYMISVFGGAYQFLSFAKYWHAKNTQARSSAGGAAEVPSEPHAVDADPSSIVGEGRRPVRARREGGSAATEPADQKSKISAVILSKNAAQTIWNCLESVRWVDEIIVVDGVSTDATVEICKKAGAKVLLDDTTDDFAKLRNAGTAAAGGDWVLQLDADEVVTGAFRKTLEKLPRTPEPYAAYKFRRQNNFLGRWMRFGGWDHQSLHLFYRGKARYEGRVHEKLLVEGRIGTLGTGVEHYPFRSLEEFIERQNRYTSLEARQMVESDPTISMETVWRQTTAKPIKLFWKMYVKKQGFREGLAGLIFSGLYAFVHFLKWAKVWEILDDQKKI